jgi:hypothetical protein
MSSGTKLRERAAIFGGAACVLAACSVDTSDIKFRPDIEFDRDVGGVANGGGVLNKAGNKGQAGSDTMPEGGEDSGGSASGGKPTGGSPSAGAPNGGVSNVGGSSPVAGAGGMAPVSGYPCMARLKVDRLIADFTGVNQPADTWMDPMKVVTFGLYTFPPNGGPALMLDQGSLIVTANVSQPAGVGIWFNPCVDASAYTTLEFSVFGSRNDGQQVLLRVGVGTNDTKMIDPMSRTGTCMPPAGINDPGYCRPPVTEVMVPMQMASGQPLAVKFADLRNGSPMATLDANQLGQLAYVEWGFIYLNGQPAYDAQLAIDNVAFK